MNPVDRAVDPMDPVDRFVDPWIGLFKWRENLKMA